MNIKSICDQTVSQMIDSMINYEKIGEYLAMQARFPQMGFENILLLLKQCPNASIVCGKGAWRRYRAKIKDGQKPIALFGPVTAPLQTDDDTENEDTDYSIIYDVLPVYDVSQIEGTDYTNEKLSELRYTMKQPIDIILKEKYNVKILDDVTGDTLKKLQNSYFNRDDDIIYLKSDLSEQDRIAELLKHYAVLAVEKQDIVSYENDLAVYLGYMLAKSFLAARDRKVVSDNKIFSAGQEEKRLFLTELQHIYFEAIQELIGYRLLDFNDTVFCNIFFESCDLSTVMSEVGIAVENADTQDIKFKIKGFLEKIHNIDEATFMKIKTYRKRQCLFTFPSPRL